MKHFSSVDDLKAASLKENQHVKVKNYYPGDRLDITYLIKTAADYGATPDEQGDHTLANGNIAILVEENPSVEFFGAVGDGSTDDYAALQAAANTGSLILTKPVYATSEPIVIPALNPYKISSASSRVKKINGTDNNYVFVFKNYLNNDPNPHVGFRQEGMLYVDANNIADYGMVAFTNSGVFLDTRAMKANKDGFLAAAKTADGTETVTVCDRNWYNVTCHNNGGRGFYASDSGNSMNLRNTIAQGSNFWTNGDYAVDLDCGIDWTVTMYEQAVNISGGGLMLRSYNAGTLVSGCKFYSGTGDLGGVTLTESGETYSAAIYAKYSDLPGPGLLRVESSFINGNVTHDGSGVVAPYGILLKNCLIGDECVIHHQYSSTLRHIILEDSHVSPNNTDIFSFHDPASIGQIHFNNLFLHETGYTVTGVVDATSKDNYQIRFNDKDYGAKYLIVDGATIDCDVEVPPMVDNDVQYAEVKVVTRDGFNGVVRVDFEGVVSVHSKVNGTDAWTAYLQSIREDAGDWTIKPVANVTDNGDGTGSVNISGLPADSSGSGYLIVNWVKQNRNLTNI